MRFWSQDSGRIERHYSYGSSPQRPPFARELINGQGGFELLHRDHQGSVVSVSDAAGALVSQSVYHPFGQQTVLWSAPTAAPNDRGYTGHRNLANVGIIHMGGRIYDPRLGRFLQADPFVQFPHASQGHNRYSYVQNNPLSHTDPSGYFLKKLGGWIKKWWRPVLGIAITVATAGKALSLGGVQGLLLASGSGAVAGAVATGSLRGAVTGALAAAAFYGIGSAFEAANCSGCFKAGKLKDTAKAVKTALHATTGGLMNVLNGGKFGHGFVSAGITQSFADPITTNFNSTPGRVVAAAIVGGTASEITGGKFANGAVTGAFSRAFNDELHRREIQNRYGDILEAGGINLDQNARDAADMTREEFISAVRTGGEWDYKNDSALVSSFGSSRLDEFGNFHFGYVARGHGYNLETTLFGAGAYQVWRQPGGNFTHHFVAARIMMHSAAGSLFPDSWSRSITQSGFTWGDNPGDSINIINGWDSCAVCD